MLLFDCLLVTLCELLMLNAHESWESVRIGYGNGCSLWQRLFAIRMEPLQKQFIYGSVILIVNLKVWKSAQSVIASFTQQIMAFLVLHAKHASTNSILHVFTNGSQHHTSPLAHCAKLLSKNYNFEQWNVQLVVF